MKASVPTPEKPPVPESTVEVTLGDEHGAGTGGFSGAGTDAFTGMLHAWLWNAFLNKAIQTNEGSALPADLAAPSLQNWLKCVAHNIKKSWFSCYYII